VLWRSVNGFLDDDCGDLAGALTYNAVLAVFPVGIVVVALVNLVTDGRTAVTTIIGILKDLGAGSVVADRNLTDVLDAIIVQQSSAKVLLSFGLLGALWSASSYVGVFTRASNRIYGVREGRAWWKLRPLQVGLSAIALVLMAVVAAALVISGPLVDAVGNALHAGDAAKLTYSIGRWPVLVLILMLLLSLLFWIAPNVRQPRFRWLTPGGAVALLAWGLASFGFGLYVANFGSYDKTYGSLGAAIAFLVWLYLSNCALMLGVEINAEVQRGRQLQAGAEDPDPPLAPREPADGEPV
jgi:membrane protein